MIFAHETWWCSIVSLNVYQRVTNSLDLEDFRPDSSDKPKPPNTSHFGDAEQLDRSQYSLWVGVWLQKRELFRDYKWLAICR